jgi:hypothetical protein
MSQSPELAVRMPVGLAACATRTTRPEGAWGKGGFSVTLEVRPNRDGDGYLLLWVHVAQRR